MKFLELLTSQWIVIQSNLILVLALIGFTAGVTWKISKNIWSGKADAASERCEYLKQKIEDLNKENNSLTTTLEQFTNRIGNLETEIDKKPNIIVSTTEPENSKAGDIWVKP